MLQSLPALPDAQTLAWWAGTGAAVGLGAWAIARIVHRNTTYGNSDRWELPHVEVPGFEPPDDKHAKWTTPRAALGLIVSGALVGALLGWLTARPSGPDSGLRLAQEVVALGVAAFVLVRVIRDIPAVGEAPPDDPELAHTARVRGALGKLAVAGLLLAVTWLMLR